MATPIGSGRALVTASIPTTDSVEHALIALNRAASIGLVASPPFSVSPMPSACAQSPPAWPACALNRSLDFHHSRRLGAAACLPVSSLSQPWVKQWSSAVDSCPGSYGLGQAGWKALDWPGFAVYALFGPGERSGSDCVRARLLAGPPATPIAGTLGRGAVQGRTAFGSVPLLSSPHPAIADDAS
jgi:hypothetical protein